jgi:hypothetical protein
MISLLLYLGLISFLVLWLDGSSMAAGNILITKRNPSEDLENWLKKFHWDRKQEPSASGSLPSYKFYSEVVEILLSLARKMGGSYQDSLLFLRAGLQADRQFEKKMREIVFSCWLQMGIIVAITWGFIFGALFIVDVKISIFKLIAIALWQLLGIFALPFLLNFYRLKYFSDIGKIWKILYILNSLVKVPLSRTEVLTMAGVGILKDIKQKSLSHIVERLKQTCQRTLQFGGSYEEDVSSLMEELRFQEKWHFELFEKRLMVIKLGLMAIFFLPSYLAFIFLLLNDLLALM